jgi:hypothetical protein
VISAHLVGYEAVLNWLRNTPDAVASGLARAITRLGIDLQQRIQAFESPSQISTSRSAVLGPNVDLQIDEGAHGVAATVSSDGEYARIPGYGAVVRTNLRASLRRVRKASGPAISDRAINKPSQSRQTLLPQRSFLRSALEDMAPDTRDRVEEAVREALTRG